MTTRRGTSSTSCPQQTHRDANDNININEDCIIKESDNEPKLDQNLEIEQNKRIEAEIIMERLDSI